MDRFVSRKRPRSPPPPTTTNEDSTDLKLALLMSLFPTMTLDTLMEILVSSNGCVETASCTIKAQTQSQIQFGSASPSKKRAKRPRNPSHPNMLTINFPDHHHQTSHKERPNPPPLFPFLHRHSHSLHPNSQLPPPITRKRPPHRTPVRIPTLHQTPLPTVRPNSPKPPFSQHLRLHARRLPLPHLGIYLRRHLPLQRPANHPAHAHRRRQSPTHRKRTDQSPGPQTALSVTTGMDPQRRIRELLRWSH